MEVATYETSEALARAAAERAVRELSKRINDTGRAVFMAATGASQIEFLAALTQHSEVDWSKTVMFHLDEYIGLPRGHPAGFRRYLRERLIDVVHPGTVHLIDGNARDPSAECARLGRLLDETGIDVAFVGLGENAHLGFNDPPADFDTEEWFTVVHLSDTCRAQQVHEGWFESPDDVPDRAITITVQGIMRSKCIVSVVPEARKAEAVTCALDGPVTPTCPASVLQRHPRTYVFLDVESASQLDEPAGHRWWQGATSEQGPGH